jgi:hypothetical protein
MIDSAAFDALVGLAQVATGLVGFSALVLAVTGESTPLNAQQRFQLREMISSGLAVVALAFVPVSLSLFGVGGDWVWRSASGVHLAVMAVAYVVIGRQLARIPAPESDAQMRVFAQVTLVAIVLLHLSNIVGWPWPTSGGPFFAALLITLGASASNFIRLLMPRL